MSELMTATEFQKASSKFMARRKNPLIMDIDNLLDLYHRSGDNPRRQIKILVLLYVWARLYQMQGGTRGGISKLLEQVKAELESAPSKLQIQLAHQGVRSKGGQMQAPANMHGKSMEKPYTMEAFIPGKDSVGGMGLHTGLKRINSPALRLLFEEEVYEKDPMLSMKDLVKASEKALGEATPTEFLEVYLKFMASPAASNQADFEYCTKDTREQYRIHINRLNGRLFRDDKFATPFSTQFGGLAKNNWALYAFDLNGRLYCKAVHDVREGGFNHSSFMSGKPVICAGAIEADAAGNLTSLSNESGHYRPTATDLGHMLVILHDSYNVNLMRTKAEVNIGGKHQSMSAYVAASIFGNQPSSHLANW